MECTLWSVKCVVCGVVSVTTSHSPDNAVRKKPATRHVESAAPAAQNDMGGLQSVAPAAKNATHLLKTWQTYCACHANHF